MMLRSYQELAIELARNKVKKDIKKIMFFLATGGGKGLIMSQLTHSSLKSGKKVLTVMRRREIIFQTIKNYKNYHGINASPIMAGMTGLDILNPCQVCSIDTIRSRIKNGSIDFIKDFDIVIVDEAHDTNSDTYQEFLSFMGDKLFLGFSATPFKINNKPLKFWQTTIKPIEPAELRDLGYLVKTRTFVPSKIDVTGVKTVAGDFNERQLLERASESKIIGDIVETYIKYGENKPAILFAINKAHSSMMAEAFRSAGIQATHQDESHNSKERAYAINALKAGEIKVLCNVNIFSTGVDIPQACVGIMARPTKSEILWIQQIGRLLRPYPGKDYAIILDHAANTERHGGAFDIRYSGLESEIGFAPKEKQIKVYTCPKCFIVTEEKTNPCVSCGHISEPNDKNRDDDIKHKDGHLIEIEEHPIEIKLRELTRQSELNKWKRSAKWFKLYNLFGEEIYKHTNVPFWMEQILRKKNGDATATEQFSV